MSILVGGRVEDEDGRRFHVERTTRDVHVIIEDSAGLHLTPAQARALAARLSDAAGDLDPAGKHVCQRSTGPALTREQGEAVRLTLVAASEALVACETGGAVIPLGVARKLLELDAVLADACRRLMESSGPAGLVHGVTKR